VLEPELLQIAKDLKSVVEPEPGPDSLGAASFFWRVLIVFLLLCMNRYRVPVLLLYLGRIEVPALV
jgi:hypothetical protein